MPRSRAILFVVLLILSLGAAPPQKKAGKAEQWTLDKIFPKTGLFGPSDERRYGPWGPHVRAVRGPRAFEDFLAVDPKLNQALNHMMDLPVDTVAAAAADLYAETEPDFANHAA